MVRCKSARGSSGRRSLMSFKFLVLVLVQVSHWETITLNVYWPMKRNICNKTLQSWSCNKMDLSLSFLLLGLEDQWKLRGIKANTHTCHTLINSSSITKTYPCKRVTDQVSLNWNKTLAQTLLTLYNNQLRSGNYQLKMSSPNKSSNKSVTLYLVCLLRKLALQDYLQLMLWL